MQRWGCTTWRDAVSAHLRLRSGGGPATDQPGVRAGGVEALSVATAGVPAHPHAFMAGVFTAPEESGSFEAWAPVSKPSFGDIGDLLSRVTKKEELAGSAHHREAAAAAAAAARRPSMAPPPAAKKPKFTVQDDGVIDLTCDDSD